jgi:hypothetical protein
MKKFLDHDNDAQELEATLRTLGTPYASNEPDSVYWSNFRLRVMERVAEGESKMAGFWPEKIREFVVGHVLKTSFSVVGLAVLVTLALLLKPFSGQQMPKMGAVAQHPAPAQTAQGAASERPSAIASAPDASSARHTHSAAKRSRAEVGEDMAMLDGSGDEPGADLQVLSATDADHPASLDELSESQLEGLLKSLGDTE